LLTRDSDKYVSLDERVRMINATKSDYVLSVHVNSAKDDTANGTETYCNVGSSKGKVFASHIQTSLVNSLNLKDRGVKEASFQILRQTTPPASLAEIAFINNPDEEKLLKDKA